MFRSKLLRRLYAGYVVIIFLFTVLAVALINRNVANNGMEDVRRLLSSNAEFLREIAEASLLAYQRGEREIKLQSKLVDLSKKVNSRLTVLAADGVVLADSHSIPANMDNHLQRPEVILAFEEGVGTSSRYSKTRKEQTYYWAIPVNSDVGLIGFVRASLPLTTINNVIYEVRAIVLFSASVAAFVALIFGLYFVRLLAEPIRNMKEVAESISRGDYDRRIVVSQDDEIGGLADAFNRMAINSEQRMIEITNDNDRLEKLLAGMVEGVIDVDENECVIHINSAAARLLNVNEKDCLGKPFWHEIRNKEIGEAVKHALESGEVIKTQIRMPSHKDDIVIDICASGLDGGAELGVMGAVIVLHDISDLDRLERIRRDFVANASHELKTPITAIRGLTETILDDKDIEREVQNRFVEKIHAQSLRLSSLVSDLMTISRLESSSQTKTDYPVNLTEVVKRSINCALPECQQKEIELSVDITEDKTIVNGDMQTYSQLVDNLVDNAIKYTLAKGKVKVQLKVDNASAILMVEDTGIGINVHDQQKIFERFYRVDKARSRGLGGTGLGLSIVKNIVEQNNGTIDLNSHLGIGSTFTVSLPLAKQVA